MMYKQYRVPKAKKAWDSNR